MLMFAMGCASGGGWGAAPALSWDGLWGATWGSLGSGEQPRRNPVIVSLPHMDPHQPSIRGADAEDSQPTDLVEEREDRGEDTDADDLTLVDRFRNGDEMAFNLLVDRYAGKILSMATYFLKSSEDAHDVAQEVFVKIHRSLHKFRGDSKLSTWIHTIAVNTCKNKLSFWKRLTTRKREFEKAQRVFYEPWTPHDEAEQSERVRIIRENILALPEKYRLVLILKDLRGVPYEEIARILDVQEGTVKSRLHRAREKLAARLAPIFRNQ